MLISFVAFLWPVVVIFKVVLYRVGYFSSYYSKIKHMGADIYINCPFLPKFIKKAREVHLMKPWRAGVDGPG